VPTLSKSRKQVLNVQGAWHPPNTIPTMVHGHAFRIMTPLVNFSAGFTIVLKHRAPLARVGGGGIFLPKIKFLRWIFAYAVEI